MKIKNWQLLNSLRSKECFPQCNEWSLADWGNAMAVETGEACNIIKKMSRDSVDLKEELGKELADIVAYVALLANAANIDLEKAMIDKFDEVSIKLGSNYRA
jgi:NTP pyrophosphatase (non-canonical NTP hydrolase)